MNKPNGISDKVWEMAEEVSDKIDDLTNGPWDADVMIVIARGIADALEQERKFILDEISMTAGSNVSLKDGLQAIRDSIRSRSKGEE